MHRSTTSWARWRAWCSTTTRAVRSASRRCRRTRAQPAQHRYEYPVRDVAIALVRVGQGMSLYVRRPAKLALRTPYRAARAGPPAPQQAGRRGPLRRRHPPSPRGRPPAHAAADGDRRAGVPEPASLRGFTSPQSRGRLTLRQPSGASILWTSTRRQVPWSARSPG